MSSRAALLLAGVGVGATAWWARKHPSACPYALRFLLAPRPLVTKDRLVDALDPRPGERLLEIGPGTGYYTLEVAQRLGDGGLAAFDIQQEMLDHVMGQAAERGVTNIEPTAGDARSLPYADASFDGAFLVTVLGEVPDQDAALRELRRVLRPGGRLVVGEMALGDPHFVSSGRLQERAAAAGLEFEQRFGPWLGYFARFRAPR